jgi:acetyl-CoA decarbonylase/synthase, CODH/ACS complex subunit gamma
MALTGLQIYKFLPRTNCTKCGYPTCLAFAMALADGKVALDKCPDIQEEQRMTLSEATRPPMKTIRFGLKECECTIGGEVALFRHEKTFYHQPLLALLLSDSLEEKDFLSKMEEIKGMEFRCAGQVLNIDMLAIKNDSGEADTFVRSVRLAREMPLLLISQDLEAVRKARGILTNQSPVVVGNFTDEWMDFAIKSDTVLAIKGRNSEELAERSGRAQSLGLERIILYPEVRGLKEALVTFTQCRKLAIERRDPEMGFPLLGWAGNDTAMACNFICKYAGIIALEPMEHDELFPLVTLRFNIFTDPQKPQVVEPKLYEVGRVNKHSPVLVTTNFSLTYFTVQPEVENSKIPSYLLITDSEGMSVQTAYAADKFNARIISNAMQNSGLKEKVGHRSIIIPGYVAVLKAALEDESGWEVIVGPKEANGIPKFLRDLHL